MGFYDKGPYGPSGPPGGDNWEEPEWENSKSPRPEGTGYGGNPAWDAPTKQTRQWGKTPKGKFQDQQKKYDEYELKHAAYTERSWWGGERKSDSRGREVKDPKRKRGAGWF